MHTGNVVYRFGEQKDYNDNFFKSYSKILSKMPLYPSLGNHDVRNVEAYLDNFILPKAASRSDSERHYSLNYGRLHLIALDTNLDFSASSAQQQWLIKDLSSKQTKGRWIIVFFHHPPFSTSRHGDNTKAQGKELVPIFGAYGVNLALSGHDHNYERFKPFN